MKQNSLFGTERKQALENIEAFCEKIKTGVETRSSENLLICGPNGKSVIANQGMAEALNRSQASIDAGADVSTIMIHSKEKDPEELFTFLEECQTFEKKTVPKQAERVDRIRPLLTDGGSS